MARSRIFWRAPASLAGQQHRATTRLNMVELILTCTQQRPFRAQLMDENCVTITLYSPRLAAGGKRTDKPAPQELFLLLLRNLSLSASSIRRRILPHSTKPATIVSDCQIESYLCEIWISSGRSRYQRLKAQQAVYLTGRHRRRSH